MPLFAHNELMTLNLKEFLNLTSPILCLEIKYFLLNTADPIPITSIGQF